MKRPQAHQINELAKRVFQNALPPTWVVNEQFDDYGIDYLVEIGADNGALTGINFFVQLKGQETVSSTGPHGDIPFSLSSKHAEYYVDQVRDLPVFLIVVDVTKKCGWMLFLQRTLRNDQIWRQQDSRTVYLPHDNCLQNTSKLKEEVADAKEWLRRNFPDFHTPFLQQCAHHLFVDHDLPSADIIDDGMVERMMIRWCPESPKGISVFDPEVGEWDHDIEVDMLHLDVDANGRLTISPCDSDGCLLATDIRNPEELSEIMDLVELLNEEVDQSNEQMLLSSLIEPTRLLIPRHDRHVLVPTQQLVEFNSAVAQIVNAFYGTEPNGWDYLVEIGFPGWEQWCRENITLSKSAEIELPGEETCVYSQPTGMTSYRRWVAFGRHYRINSLPVAMNRKERASVMFLCDLFNDTKAGREQLNRILRNCVIPEENDLGTIEAPTSKLGQIRTAFEFRTKQEYNA